MKVRGETFLSSSNKAEMSKPKVVRMVRWHAGNKVPSQCELMLHFTASVRLQVALCHLCANIRSGSG